jgi:hypothetical protein
MPSFIFSPQVHQVAALYPGQSIALVNNAAVDGSVTQTVQVAIGPDPDSNYRLNITNTTNQTATVDVAPRDPVLPSPALASYQPYSDEGTAITVAANTSNTFSCFGPWLSCNFATAPTSGSLILSR